MSEVGKLLISFSGGETSAYMTHWALKNWRERYPEILVVFSNTGQENEETLVFVRDCDNYFGFETVWVEAMHPQPEAEPYRGIRPFNRLASRRIRLGHRYTGR